MKDWKYRIGLLVPSINIVAEPTFHLYVPPNITVHTSRMPRDDMKSTIETHINMLKHIENVAKLVAHCKPDVLVMADTTASFIQGKGSDLYIAQKMKEATGIKSITASTAVLEALHALKAKGITIITPYPAYTNQKEKIFFEDNGFQVDVLASMEIAYSLNMGLVHPSDIFQFTLDKYNLKSEAIFISCTNFRGTEVINNLENNTELPVVTSNQACLWSSLKTMGLKTNIGLGKLFQAF
jgi:maleate isomerase